MPRSLLKKAQTGWFPFGTTPPAPPFLEFDGLAGTPPNSGGEFQTRDWNSLTLFGAGADDHHDALRIPPHSLPHPAPHPDDSDRSLRNSQPVSQAGKPPVHALLQNPRGVRARPRPHR